MTRSLVPIDTPVLGVIAHHLLRVRAVVEMRQEAPLAVFAPPDSPLMEVADICCPIRSLDISLEEFDEAVEKVVRRGVNLRGILAIRDGNVYGAAAACRKRGWPSPPLGVLQHVRNKSAFRSWLDTNGSALGCRVIPWRLITADMPYDLFCREMRDLYATIEGLARGPKPGIILKPDAGSCSQLIMRLDSDHLTELEQAWTMLHRGRTFRNGRFLAEEAVDGREIAIDTISTTELTRTFVTGYLPRDAGTFYTAGAVVPPHPPLKEREELSASGLATQLHLALGLKPAVTHMEVILPDDGSESVIVELNPRMGGGMLQEMHRLVSGVQMFRLAARLALGRMEVKELLGGNVTGPNFANQVLIRFRRPGIGKMTVGRGAPDLQHQVERFRFLQPANTMLSGGLSDDDLLAWCLLAAMPGDYENPEESFRSLLTRADELMLGWLPEAM